MACWQLSVPLIKMDPFASDLDIKSHSVFFGRVDDVLGANKSTIDQSISFYKVGAAISCGALDLTDS